MKKTLILTFTILTNFAFAQKIATWVGGTPGQENAWNTAKNWSNNHVPDDLTSVVIKVQNTGHQAQPILNTKVIVAELNIYAGASLTIANNGVLEINGEQTYSHGIVIANGNLINQGQIFIENIDKIIDASLLEKIKGNGTIFIDDVNMNRNHYAQVQAHTQNTK